MRKNMGSVDRGIRLLVALVFAGLFFSGTVAGTVGYLLLAVAIVFALTSVVSFCPLYTLLDISTCSVSEKSKS